MIKLATLMMTVGALNACSKDESIAGYAQPETDYHLVELDGAAFDGRATIRFEQGGRVVGQGPCNRYSATQTEIYPWFGIGPIAATRMACPDLDAEAAFFAALTAVSLAEVHGQTLLLTTTDGREMLFRTR